jgi:hypothetical protein
MDSGKFHSQFHIQHKKWKGLNLDLINDLIPHKAKKILNDINKKIELINNIKESIPINLQNKETIGVFENIYSITKTIYDVYRNNDFNQITFNINNDQL